jgi:2'-5' RNA ligase
MLRQEGLCPVYALVDVCSRPVDTRPFDAVFGGIGVFPPRGAPRALWIGIETGRNELAALHTEIASRLARPALAGDGGAFRPHLTLGRWRRSRPSDRAGVLALASNTPVARCRIDQVTLYRSELPSARREGPAYTVLARANLTGAS